MGRWQRILDLLDWSCVVCEKVFDYSCIFTPEYPLHIFLGEYDSLLSNTAIPSCPLGLASLVEVQSLVIHRPPFFYTLDKSLSQGVLHKKYCCVHFDIFSSVSLECSPGWCCTSFLYH